MTSIDLLKEIESWLSFNTEPSNEETAKLRKSIKEHLVEQLRIHDVVGHSEQLVCEKCKEPMVEPYAERYGKKFCLGCM